MVIKMTLVLQVNLNLTHLYFTVKIYFTVKAKASPVLDVRAIGLTHRVFSTYNAE